MICRAKKKKIFKVLITNTMLVQQNYQDYNDFQNFNIFPHPKS